MYDLSILIPARNEEYLKRTIEDILSNVEGDTEIIAVLDGYWPKEPIEDHPRVTLIHHESIGQRAAQNEAARISKAKYVMKVDAHCAFDKGFDVKMMDAMEDDMTMVPLMRNLHVFDWVCPDGHRRYQGPEGVCTECGKETTKDIVWIAKKNPQSTAYRLNKELRFKYWGEYKKKQVGDIVETMTLAGSCFMATRENYWEKELCDETWGSWGQQGSEVALKTWLSGGRLITNKKTWYAHLFRTQDGFSWPYPNSGESQQKARKICQDIFLNDKWPKAKHKLQWLIDKFDPPEWDISNKISKGIVYYTDNQLNLKIAHRVQKQLNSIGLPIVNVSLKLMPNFGKNICIPLERSLLTMSRQILAGLEALDTDVVFLAEHDVLYHPSHFDFTPSEKDVYYYNTNSWFLRSEDGHCLYYFHRCQSGLCAYRETLIKYYKERIRRIEELEASAVDGIVKATSGNDIPLREGIHRLGFEPGTHNRPERIDELPCGDWRSELPNVDIKHEKNWTMNRWSIDKFRDKSVSKTWKESDRIPFWGRGRKIL